MINILPGLKVKICGVEQIVRKIDGDIVTFYKDKNDTAESVLFIRNIDQADCIEPDYKVEILNCYADKAKTEDLMMSVWEYDTDDIILMGRQLIIDSFAMAFSGTNNITGGFFIPDSIINKPKIVLGHELMAEENFVGDSFYLYRDDVSIDYINWLINYDKKYDKVLKRIYKFNKLKFTGLSDSLKDFLETNQYEKLMNDIMNPPVNSFDKNIIADSITDADGNIISLKEEHETTDKVKDVL